VKYTFPDISIGQIQPSPHSNRAQASCPRSHSHTPLHKWTFTAVVITLSQETKTMALKLYGLPMSTNTTRVMICLHEKEVDFELVPVNVFSAEHKQPPFLSKNVSLQLHRIFLSLIT